MRLPASSKKSASSTFDELVMMKRVKISTTRFNLELDDVLISSVVMGKSDGERSYT
jgi:hypothetical protein